MEYIKDVTCPILFIHGQRDKLIPYTHTLKLKDNCKSPYEVIFPEAMDHSLVNVKKDLTEPIENFLTKHTEYNFDTNSTEENYKVDEKFRQIPIEIAEKFKGFSDMFEK